MKRFTLKELEELPTLAIGQASDLKIQEVNTRVWLARTTKEDGEDYDNRVMVEVYFDGEWQIAEEYEAV